MKKLISIIIVFFTLNLSIKANDIPKLKKAITSELLSNTKTDAIVGGLADKYFPDGTNYDLCLKELIAHALPKDYDVEKLIESINSDGSWCNIDYKCPKRSSWSPQLHVDNILKIARCYRSKDSKFYNSKEALGTALKAISYWCDGEFKCNNWWYNEIGVPKVFAPTLLLLEKEINTELMEKGIKILDAADKNAATGQNKVWLSGVTFIKGLLLNDKSIVERSSSSIKEELKITDLEGIQKDYSYQQHGAMLQFGNYGLAFASSISYWMRIFSNTEYEFNPEQKTIMRNYMTKGLAITTWKGAMDVSSCVRQLIVNGQEGKAASLLKSNLNMIKVDNDAKKLYKGYITRNYTNPEINDLTGNFVYPISKYTVHRADDFLFSVKMCSKKILGGETTNDENLKGYYLSDGATMIYVNGKEYSNIFPIWDGKHMPGTTVELNDNPLKVIKDSRQSLNGSNFVGGIDNGMFGVTAMEYIRDGVKANKSWFFLGSEVICLGNNITTESGNPTVTTLNQCNFQDKAYYQSPEGINKLEKDIKTNSSKVYCDNIGYESLDDSPIEFIVKEQKGDWHDVAHFYDHNKVKGEVFTAQITHKANKSNSYAYLVKPCIEKDVFFNETAKDFIITQNDSSATVIESEKNNITMIVFWEAGSINSVLFDKIESPCPKMLILEKSNGKITKKSYNPLK